MPEHSTKPEHSGGNSVRDFFTLWLTNMDAFLAERDRRYEERYDSQERLFMASLEALEKMTNAAFVSSEKAVTKAEEAQKEYNIRSNEFRGQLDDQAKTLMPRTEATALISSTISRMEERDKAVDGRLLALETWRAQNAGKGEGQAPFIAVGFSVLTAVLAAVAVVVATTR